MVLPRNGRRSRMLGVRTRFHRGVGQMVQVLIHLALPTLNSLNSNISGGSTSQKGFEWIIPLSASQNNGCKRWLSLPKDLAVTDLSQVMSDSQEEYGDFTSGPDMNQKGNRSLVTPNRGCSRSVWSCRSGCLVFVGQWCLCSIDHLLWQKPGRNISVFVSVD